MCLAFSWVNITGFFCGPDNDFTFSRGICTEVVMMDRRGHVFQGAERKEGGFSYGEGWKNGFNDTMKKDLQAQSSARP